jgi:hypothetical protein
MLRELIRSGAITLIQLLNENGDKSSQARDIRKAQRLWNEYFEGK